MAEKQEETRAVIARLPIKARHAHLNTYFVSRAKWADFRADDCSQAAMLRWIEQTFPDRRALGLVLSDLRHLDRQAYERIMNWGRKGRRQHNDLPRFFGFPTKRSVHDALIDNHGVPTGADFFKSWRDGDPDAVVKGRYVAMYSSRQRRQRSCSP